MKQYRKLYTETWIINKKLIENKNRNFTEKCYVLKSLSLDVEVEIMHVRGNLLPTYREITIFLTFVPPNVGQG